MKISKSSLSKQTLLLSSAFILYSFSAPHVYANGLAPIVNNPLDYNSTNSLLLSQYKDNFLLPIYYTQRPNFKEYQNEIPSGDKLSNYNVNFQISLKYNVASNLLTNNDHLYIGYTQRSNWQAYASSAYFRDTEYEPSVFWSFSVNPDANSWHYAGTTVGLVHESNGRGGNSERSWNRAFADFTFQKNAFTLSVKPWVRLDLGAKNYNKDINNYLGDGRVSMNWAVNKDNLVSFTFRNVLESGFSRGYEKLTWNFPIYKRLRGYLLLESGYGISISDWNRYDNAGGIGFSF